MHKSLPYIVVTSKAQRQSAIMELYVAGKRMFGQSSSESANSIINSAYIDNTVLAFINKEACFFNSKDEDSCLRLAKQYKCIAIRCNSVRHMLRIK